MTRPAVKSILAEAKARKLPRALAVYATTGFTVLGAVNLFSGKYGLSPRLFDSLAAILVCGLPVVVARRLARGGDAPPSAREADRKLTAMMSDRARPHNNLAFALLKLGDAEESRRLFEENIRAFEAAPVLGQEGSPFPYLLAQAAAALGRPDEAFRRLDQAWKQGGFARWVYLDPIIESLRPDPRFKASLAVMQARLEVMRRRVRGLGLDE